MHCIAKCHVQPFWAGRLQLTACARPASNILLGRPGFSVFRYYKDRMALGLQQPENAAAADTFKKVMQGRDELGKAKQRQELPEW